MRYTPFTGRPPVIYFYLERATAGSSVYFIASQAPRGAENTRCNTQRGQPCGRENYRQHFRWSYCHQVQMRETVRLGVGAPLKYPRLAACGSQRTAQCPGDDTYMRWSHSQCGRKSTDCTVPNKDAHKSERDTPTICEHCTSHMEPLV